jgi:hypothetical protein
MNFISTNKFPPDDQGNTSEYFTARNDAGQIVAQIIRSDHPSVPSVFYGYRMLIPGVGGKAQSKHLRRFEPFDSFEEVQEAIEDDFAAPANEGANEDQEIAELRRSADSAHLAASTEAARANKAEAELTRLTVLLEDRTALRNFIEQATNEWASRSNKPGISEWLADRIPAAYLTEKK